MRRSKSTWASGWKGWLCLGGTGGCLTADLVAQEVKGEMVVSAQRHLSQPTCLQQQQHTKKMQQQLPDFSGDTAPDPDLSVSAQSVGVDHNSGHEQHSGACTSSSHAQYQSRLPATQIASLHGPQPFVRRYSINGNYHNPVSRSEHRQPEPRQQQALGQQLQQQQQHQHQHTDKGPGHHHHLDSNYTARHSSGAQLPTRQDSDCSCRSDDFDIDVPSRHPQPDLATMSSGALSSGSPRRTHGATTSQPHTAYSAIQDAHRAAAAMAGGHHQFPPATADSLASSSLQYQPPVGSFRANCQRLASAPLIGYPPGAGASGAAMACSSTSWGPGAGLSGTGGGGGTDSSARPPTAPRVNGSLGIYSGLVATRRQLSTGHPSFNTASSQAHPALAIVADGGSPSPEAGSSHGGSGGGCSTASVRGSACPNSADPGNTVAVALSRNSDSEGLPQPNNVRRSLESAQDAQSSPCQLVRASLDSLTRSRTAEAGATTASAAAAAAATTVSSSSTLSRLGVGSGGWPGPKKLAPLSVVHVPSFTGSSCRGSTGGAGVTGHMRQQRPSDSGPRPPREGSHPLRNKPPGRSSNTMEARQWLDHHQGAAAVAVHASGGSSSCSAQLQERQRELVKLRLQVRADKMAMQRRPSHDTVAGAAAAVAAGLLAGGKWLNVPGPLGSPASSTRSISRLLLEGGSEELEEERDQREAMLQYLQGLTAANAANGKRRASRAAYDMDHLSSGSPVARPTAGSSTSHRSILGRDDELRELAPLHVRRNNNNIVRGQGGQGGSEAAPWPCSPPHPVSVDTGMAEGMAGRTADGGASSPLPRVEGGHDVMANAQPRDSFAPDRAHSLPFTEESRPKASA